MFKPWLIKRGILADWAVMRLLWIGSHDENSVLYGVPKDVLRLIARAGEWQTSYHGFFKRWGRWVWLFCFL